MLVLDSQMTLRANLGALRPATRAVIEGATSGPRVKITGPTSASVLSAGRWVSIHPTADPIGAGEELIDHLASRGSTPVLVIVGIGLGYLLDAIERKGSDLRVVAIEPVPTIARAMLERRDWRGWLDTGRLTMVVGPDYADAPDAARTIPVGEGTPPVIITPLMQKEFGSHVPRARAVAAQVVAGARANREARKAFAGRYLLNTLRNLPVIASEGDAAALTDAFRGTPAVVVGAGPSLDANVAAIRRVQDRALVIAVDTAIRPLHAAGIRPHVAVSVDPTELNARHVVDLPDVRGLWFVSEGSVDPGAFAQFAGRTFTFKVSRHHPWPWLTQHDIDRGTLQAWGSVLTTAFDLARVMGCDPIVFAGADLAYTGGVLYCQNTVYEPEWRHLTSPEAREQEFREFLKVRPNLRLPGIDGDAVLTAPHFVQFRDWLVSQSLVHADRRIVNATGAGILCGGRIEVASLDDLSLAAPLSGHRSAEAVLMNAWLSGAGRRAQLQQRLAPTLLSDDVRAVAAGEWLEFGGDTASSRDIAGAVDDAARGIAVQAGKRAYAAMQRGYYDQRAGTLGEARALVHADYEWASVQAPAHQSHVLLDFMQRSYGVVPSGQLQAVVERATAMPSGIRILDFGCGVGRSMVPLARAGFRVDGVDISERMLGFARADASLSGSELYLGQGNDLGAAPDGSYDLIYSQLCLQHISSRSIRNDLLQSFARALKPGGAMLVQLHFYPNRNAATVPTPHVPWSADYFEATGTNGEADVWATPDQLHLVYADFARHFQDLRLQFVDFAPDTTLFTGPSQSWFSHLVVSGSVGHQLAARMYAPLARPLTTL